jgi:hypothetical protein
MTLYLDRGLPGSGKSTLAQKLAPRACSADDFYMVNGVYQFDPAALAYAHAHCQSRTRAALSRGLPVAVTNTFAQRWEMEPYLQMAQLYGYRVTVIDLYDNGLTDEQLAYLTVHGVPEERIAAMRARWEHDWRTASPCRPPVQVSGAETGYPGSEDRGIPTGYPRIT